MGKCVWIEFSAKPCTYFFLQFLQLPVLFGEEQSIEQKNIDLLHEAYSIIEKFLEENEWIAGDNMTIADFSAYATMSAANIAIPVNASKYMRLAEWMKRMESLPATSGLANKGLKTFKKFAMSKLSKWARFFVLGC